MELIYCILEPDGENLMINKMTNNKRIALSICPLENQISQNLSEENLKEIRGGFTKLPDPISAPSRPTPPPSDPIICPLPPSM
ncbi:MAG: hypothetical protein ACFB14_06080 [Leptolyngbyaceae cyanobacterium]